MKANELMIGDWVIVDEIGCLTPIKVLEVGINYAVVYDDDSETMEDYLQPIPVTAKILEKNGFKSRDNFYEITFQRNIIYNSIFRIVEFEKSGNWFFGFCDFPNLIENLRINYVHELQHALRLCGLNDLADNFKI